MDIVVNFNGYFEGKEISILSPITAISYWIEEE